MKKLTVAALKILLAYLLAGAICTLFVFWPHYEGHEHIPFSGFPSFLVWSPAAPYMLILEVEEQAAKAAMGLVIFLTSFLSMLWILFHQRTRKDSPDVPQLIKPSCNEGPT